MNRNTDTVSVFGSVSLPRVPPELRRFKRPSDHIAPETLRKVRWQRDLAWFLAGLLWMALVGMVLKWNVERVRAHKLRANIAAMCAVNPVPPYLWQPTWSDDK